MGEPADKEACDSWGELLDDQPTDGPIVDPGPQNEPGGTPVRPPPPPLFQPSVIKTEDHEPGFYLTAVKADEAAHKAAGLYKTAGSMIAHGIEALPVAEPLPARQGPDTTLPYDQSKVQAAKDRANLMRAPDPHTLRGRIVIGAQGPEPAEPPAPPADEHQAIPPPPFDPDDPDAIEFEIETAPDDQVVTPGLWARFLKRLFH